MLKEVGDSDSDVPAKRQTWGSRVSGTLLFALKLTVSGGLLVWIIIRADLTDFGDAFKHTNLWLYGLSLLLMAVGLWVRSYKWKVLLRVQNAEMPLRDLLSVTYISMFLNNKRSRHTGRGVRLLSGTGRINRYAGVTRGCTRKSCDIARQPGWCLVVAISPPRTQVKMMLTESIDRLGSRQ